MPSIKVLKLKFKPEIKILTIKFKIKAIFK